MGRMGLRGDWRKIEGVLLATRGSVERDEVWRREACQLGVTEPLSQEFIWEQCNAR